VTYAVDNLEILLQSEFNLNGNC